MASTYSQDNVGSGVDSIVSSPVNQTVGYSRESVSETDIYRQTDRQTVVRQSVSQADQSVRHSVKQSVSEMALVFSVKSREAQIINFLQHD